MHAKSHNFHYTRGGTSDELIKMHEDLVFTNSPPGVYWDSIPSCNNYPYLSSDLVYHSIFADILQSEWPIELNWSYKSSEKAMNMLDLDNLTPLCMSMDLCNSISLEHL